jgi:F0F1-type ATP synthase membrane subunit b/b'
VKLAIVGAEKLIEKEINEASHSDMLTKLAAQL